MARKNPKSPVGIARYANLFTPRARKGKDGKPDGDPKYSLLLVFDRKADLDELEAEIERVAVEKFGSKAASLLANGRLRSPLRDAEEYVDEEAGDEENYPFNLPGARMVRFASKEKPGVVDENADPIMEKSEFYDGCKARVSYRAFAYDSNGNKGVSVALVNVQKVGDGRRLSGNVSAEDEFKAESKPAKKVRRPSSDVDDLL